MEFRAATIDDLAFIAQIDSDSFPGCPKWDYRFPDRWETPEDKSHFSRIYFRWIINNPERFKVTVACCETNEEPKHIRPVAFAIWSTFYIHHPDSSVLLEWPLDHRDLSDIEQKRCDANPFYAEAKEVQSKALAGAKKSYFDKAYGNKQIHLMLLATHPHYRHRGAASTLVKLGLDGARRHEMATTLFGTAKATPFYASLGFKLLGKVTIELGNQVAEISAMAFELYGKNGGPSLN